MNIQCKYIKLLKVKFLFIINENKEKVVMSMKHLHIRIVELLSEHGISKTKICKDLDLQRGNFNRYCRDDFQRVDANLIIKLCEYFDCSVGELLEISDDE